MRFHIVSFFTRIRSIMLRYDVVKDNIFIKMVNYVLHFGYRPSKWPLQIYFTYRFKVGSFPCKIPPVSSLHARQFPSTSINPENGQEGRFSSEELIALNVARASLWTTVYLLANLSNGAYRVSLRPSVVEQSTQDWSGVAPLFDPVNFPGSNVKPIANNGARDHVVKAASLL